MKLVNKKSFPKEIRPRFCKWCQKEIFFHHHGHYERFVYTLTEQLMIIIHRFICPLCRHTKGYLPNFIESHRQTAWEIHEEVLEKNNQGISLEKAGEEISRPAGPYSAKTTWRWKKYWEQIIQEKEHKIWELLLIHNPHLNIPVAQSKGKTPLDWLLKIWPGIQGGFRDKPGLLQWLYTIIKTHPPAVTAGR